MKKVLEDVKTVDLFNTSLGYTLVVPKDVDAISDTALACLWDEMLDTVIFQSPVTIFYHTKKERGIFERFKNLKTFIFLPNIKKGPYDLAIWGVRFLQDQPFGSQWNVYAPRETCSHFQAVFNNVKKADPGRYRGVGTDCQVQFLPLENLKNYEILKKRFPENFNDGANLGRDGKQQ